MQNRFLVWDLSVFVLENLFHIAPALPCDNVDFNDENFEMA